MMQLHPETKRNLATVAVGLLGLAFIPGIGPYVINFMTYKVGGSFLTPGLVIGGFGLYIAYLLYQRRI